MSLLQKEISAQGFSVMENHFDAQLVQNAFQEIRSRLDVFTNDREIRYPHLLGTHPIFESLLTSSLMEQIHQIMGEVTNLSDIEIVSLQPGAAGLNPHIDHPYVLMDQVYPGPILSLQTIWVLQDLTLENGATTAVPKSHLNCAWPDSSFSREAQPILAPAGSIIFMHGAIWHGTMANQSSQERSNLLITFIPPWIQPLSKVDKNLVGTASSSILKELLGHNNIRFLRKRLKEKQGVQYSKVEKP